MDMHFRLLIFAALPVLAQTIPPAVLQDLVTANHILANEGVLDGVGFSGALRTRRGGEFGKAFVVDPGLGQKFCGTGHLNMVAIASSCDPGCDTAPPPPGALP